jgi:hypothetical protein
MAAAMILLFAFWRQFLSMGTCPQKPCAALASLAFALPDAEMDWQLWPKA